MTTTTVVNATDDTGETCVLHSAELTGEVMPRRVLVAPWGKVESTNGSFVVDEEAARLAVEAFEAHGTDLPIDYEHQTLGGVYASPTGQAPAAGWIKRLVAEPGVGLLAEIEWTEQAERMLGNREYRYLSPVAIIRKRDRKLTAIHSVALTNKPAIIGMEPIVNSTGGLVDGDEVEPLTALRRELALSDDADPEQVLLAASVRLADLHRESKRQHIEQRIVEALREGKLVEAQRTWAEALVAREEGLFDEWLRSAPVIVQPGRLGAPRELHAPAQREQAVSARARAEFRSHAALSALTSEEAFVADALRQAAQ